MPPLYLHVIDPEKIELIEQKGFENADAIKAIAKLLYSNIGRGRVVVFFKYLFPNLTKEQYGVLIDERLKQLTTAHEQELLNLYREVDVEGT